MAPIALLLGGCMATLPERVEIPVPVACIDAKDVPARPVLVPDTDLRSASRGQRVFALKNYQDLAAPYIEQLETIAQRCATKP